MEGKLNKVQKAVTKYEEVVEGVVITLSADELADIISAMGKVGFGYDLYLQLKDLQREIRV